MRNSSTQGNCMIKVGIVGGSGYTGVELLRLLADHPYVKLKVITSRRDNGVAISDVYPSFRQKTDLKFSTLDKDSLIECDIVFFATPCGIAMSQATRLIKSNIKVIDLGADFRLQDTSTFEKYYKIKHSCPDLLKEAIYGLPELNRTAIKSAKIIGNPGCYPTTIQIALAPLLRADAVDTSRIIADCKSGISGAGRKAELALLFSEINDNFKAYGISGHRHVPEIIEQLRKLTAKKIDLLFTPHLVPMVRGMYSTIYAPLLKDFSTRELQSIFRNAYKNEPFIDVMPLGSYPETRFTRGSNMLQLSLHRPRDSDIVILVSQDNLLKGAAGQAVQCMNLMYDLEETTGLLHIPIIP